MTLDDSIPDFQSMHADPRLAPFLSAFPCGLFDDRLWRSIAWADRYVDALVLDVLARLDLTARLSTWQAADELCAAALLAPEFAPRAAWMLDRLVMAGLMVIETSTGHRRYRAPVALPRINIAALRAAGLAVDPGNLATATLLDAACTAWPQLARGEASGEDALFGAGEIGLWLDYFANSNTLYAANNRMSALVAADRLIHLPQLSVLELGAGAGSGTEALLAEISGRGWMDRITSYFVTEPSAFFRRRADRRLAARVERPVLSFRNLDIDRPWREQGIGEAAFDLVFAVNVLHVADDLLFSLKEARRHLRPGGWLVAGECLRPFPGYPIYIEFVFRLLDSFLDVHTCPEVRPEAGFLAPETWQRALSRAGFTEIEIIPDHVRIRELEPRFVLGVLCAR